MKYNNKTLVINTDAFDKHLTQHLNHLIKLYLTTNLHEKKNVNKFVNALTQAALKIYIAILPVSNELVELYENYEIEYDQNAINIITDALKEKLTKIKKEKEILNENIKLN